MQPGHGLSGTDVRCRPPKKGGTAQCSDPRDRHEPAGNILSICNRSDLPRYVVDALLQPAQVGEQIREQFAHRRREVIGRIVQNQWQVELEQAGSLSQCNAVFQAKCPHLVDQTRSRADHLVAHLFLALDCSEPHRGSRGRFCDSLGIDDVALVRLHVGLT